MDIIYPTTSIDDRQTVIRKYWKKRKGESTVLENVEFICYPLAHNHNLDVMRFLLKGIPLAYKRNLDIILKRIEYWQINKYSENKKYRQEYLCELPRFSVEEILASKRFNNDDVNFAFTALQDLKLIEPSMEFQGKTRFIISDRSLRELSNPFVDYS